MEEVLEHIPKKTPTWAIGMVTVLAMLGTMAVVLGVMFRDDIRANLTWAEKHHELSDTNEDVRLDKEIADKSKYYDATLTAVLGLIDTNSKSIVEIAKQVGASQQQNIILTDRVNGLEMELSKLQNSLRDCEGKLLSCQKTK